MKHGFTVANMICASCKQGFQFQPNFVETVEDVERTAGEAHATSKIICGTPQLIVSYMAAMVSDGMFEPVVQITGVNGKASAH